MSLLENQEHLIAQTQLFYDELFNSGKYAEAIAISKAILDLSTAYKELATIYPPISRDSESHSLSGMAFGQTNFNQINQTLRELTQPLYPARFGSARAQLGDITYKDKVNQYEQPPQPSTYSWADGFHGVSVPPREVNIPTSPNPNQTSSAPSDYWEDSRRQ